MMLGLVDIKGLLGSVLIEGELDGCRDCFADIGGASLGNEEGWLETEGNPLGISLGAADFKRRMLGLLLMLVLIEGESDDCRDGFFDLDGASLGNEKGWLEPKGNPLGMRLCSVEIKRPHAWLVAWASADQRWIRRL